MILAYLARAISEVQVALGGIEGCQAYAEVFARRLFQETRSASTSRNLRCAAVGDLRTSLLYACVVATFEEETSFGDIGWLNLDVRLVGCCLHRYGPTFVSEADGIHEVLL